MAFNRLATWSPSILLIDKEWVSLSNTTTMFLAWPAQTHKATPAENLLNTPITFEETSSTLHQWCLNKYIFLAYSIWRRVKFICCRLLFERLQFGDTEFNFAQSDGLIKWSEDKSGLLPSWYFSLELSLWLIQIQIHPNYCNPTFISVLHYIFGYVGFQNYFQAKIITVDNLSTCILKCSGWML